MYLKRLELQGFKSFATKTLFEFGPGITSVVGPNGSGKSNVAESLRWVLGEQHSRNVRARRLEDVIFSGSSQKSAVGMAEVSITLDNSEGWLPVDYSEVVVSRRAYRSGESEYLINKNKVRLRDVVDLFMRAQVGQNSYAFMGQGLVEEVLVMRPEERRRLLEEAADVRLLRQRLDEARDRLAATRENLDRVQLLLEEIGPRLRQLERQANRAAEHSRLAAELQETLRELYGRHWQEAQEKLTSGQASLDQKQQEMVVTQNEVKACEEGLVALSLAVEEREKELADRRIRQRDLADRVHTLEQRQGFDAERLESQTRHRAEIEAELQSLRDERSDLQASLTQAQERGASILPEIEAAKALIETRRQEMNETEQEYASLRRRIAESEERIERAQRGAAEAEASLTRLTEEEERTQGQTSQRGDRQEQIEADIEELEEGQQEHEGRMARLDEEIADAEEERNGLLNAIEGAREASLRLEREAMQVEGQIGQLRAREAMLRGLQSAQDGMDSGARFLLGEEGDEGRQNAMEGLVGLVQDIVRVPPGLERAIEAALAENVQALVFENLPLAMQAIDALEQREAGRAIIYPLDAIRNSPPLNLMREKGIIGVAARLVRCDNRFRPLVDSLLGRIIVVETVGLAQQVLRRGLGSVVSMDGVLLRPNGALAGGLTRTAGQSFSRQHELEELPGEIARAEERKTDLDVALRREQDRLTSASEALEQLEPRLYELREERSRRQSDMLESRGQLVLLRSQMEVLQAEAARGDDPTDWAGRRVRLTEEIERYQAEARQLEESIAAEREALTQLTPRRSASIDSVSEAAAAHADLEGEARSLTRQLELVNATMARTEERLSAREASMRALEAEIAELTERSSGSEELTAAREELAGLQGEMEPAEGELQHLAGRERAMREQLDSARGRLLDAERAQLEAEAAVKLHSDEIEALRETIEGEGFRTDGDRVLLAEGSAVLEQQGHMPPIRGGAEVDSDTLRTRVSTLRASIRGLGPVNEEAAEDYNENKERFDFLQGQVEDLEGSEETLLGAIDELETNIRERLKATFAIVDKEFQRYFEAFFNGGKAHLSLTQPDDFANTGVDIVAQPPGKRVHTLAMLSGGERALTSLALLLSLLEANPSPICVLDEVDAALDETNVGRFVDALRALEQKTQFIVITHNPRTIEAADSIYGVSMGADSTSRILSLRLDDLKN
ncbi:MAG TPA: chromosome segregation protein SMC [Dehalococcoidia bacterium]|nr:chromosome segregation protein SMC [Dehalococcoidia bacterium]